MIIKKKQMKYSKIIYIFLFALISIITILLISYINSANSFSCDNYNFGLYKNGENILSPLLNGVDKAHGGGYIVSFITKLIDFALPTFLNIHPADFIGKAQGTIQGIIFCITCYIMANTLTIGNKNTLTHFAGYFFTIGVLLFEIVHTNSQYLFFSTNEFYRYIFISLFFLLLWQNIYKLTFNKEKLSNWNIVLTVISSFIIATNLELLIFISYILFFFLILFLIVYKIKKKQLFCKQNKAILEHTPIVPQTFPYQIAYNLIPQIGDFYENGYTSEEMKMQNEGRRILHAEDLLVSCTCVRVPVLRSHSISIMLETESPLELSAVKNGIQHASGCKYMDDPENKIYPMPLDTTNQDLVYVGRIRKDLTNDHGIVLWCCGDQIRKGAATNAVQIAEVLIQDHN